jgi:hypothetical protein
MKPLVYYCRWQGAVLRLRGRDETAVWGALVFNEANGRTREQEFHFELKTWVLRLITDDGETTLQLDEMGTIISSS